MNYSISITEVFTLLGAICGLASTIIVFLARTAIAQRESAISDHLSSFDASTKKLEASISKIEKESDDGFKSMSVRITDAVHQSSKRTEDLAAESMRELSRAYDAQKELTERLHREEMSTVRIDGDLRVAKQAQESTARELSMLRESIITRAEWDARISSIEKTIETMLNAIQVSGRYSSTSRPQINRSNSSPPER